MIIRIVYILSLIYTTFSEECIHHKRYKGISNVVADCVHPLIAYNSSIYLREWYTFDAKIFDKPPYYFLTNGSLMIKEVSERSTHYFCVVSNALTKDVIYKCGTAITIIYPLVLKYTPRNETVDKNTSYSIDCHAGGGDLPDLKLMYFVNDRRVFVKGPYIIVEDTKIECRVTSGGDSLSVIGYITVKKKGIMTDEEKFVYKKCGHINKGLCSAIIPEKSFRIYNDFPKSNAIVENLLMQLFNVLDNKIVPEYYENQCVDRFKRMVCSVFYPFCDNGKNGPLAQIPICRESCEAIVSIICLQIMADIRKHVNEVSRKFTNPFLEKNESPPKYENKFIDDLISLTKSLETCSHLPAYGSGSAKHQCALLDLDVNPGNQTIEKIESKCFNEVGRNYTGEKTFIEKNKECIKWDRIPQIYLAFYQQNLQNQSNFCRNPGGIFDIPRCARSLKKSLLKLRFEDIDLVPCRNIQNCKAVLLYDSPNMAKNESLVIIVVVVSLLTVISIVVVIVVKRSGKKRHTINKKPDTHENIPLNDDDVNIYQNKVYKHPTGAYTCPIYNAAHLEKVQSLALGEYGEIILVQAVINNISSIIIDENNYYQADKLNRTVRRQRSTKSTSDSDAESIDDLILSDDKMFNEKPCWPLDKSSPSGCCPFAVIKYSTNSENGQKEKRFNKETKILSQLNHPHILRFYGVCLHISNKVSCRIVEYLPNGDIKSILTGRRREPPQLSNHENNNKIKNGYQSVNALKKNRVFKTDDSITIDETKSVKRKNNSSFHSRDVVERPQPAEHIDLTNKQLVKWGVGICDAVIYLHTKHLIHRDIATRNCLVGINLEAKLADFSFVQKFSYGYDLIGKPNEYIPIRWLPKETLEELIFNTDTDVWMFGVYLWELMSLGKDPYHEYNLNEVYDAIVSDTKLENPPNCPVEIYQQMQLCFAPPRQRPCLELVKNNLIKILNDL